MLENGAADFARGEDGEDAHAAATDVANQDIDGEHALEQVGPGEPTARRGMGLICKAAYGDTPIDDALRATTQFKTLLAWQHWVSALPLRVKTSAP